jgi:farnesyl diphosphate synthase
MSVPDTAIQVLKRPLQPDEFRLTSTLGWLTELLQAFFLVSDDIMDASVTRRGEPCWYRQHAVGMIAINDAFMLESAIYLILKKHFRSHPAYLDLIELFHEVTFQTELGQLCDLITAPEDQVDLNNFSMEKYTFIVIYKTAYYMDAFGDPSVIGKIGTDIKDNKCGWLINQALLICTPEQRQLLDDNYGRKDDAKEAKVKKLYKELQLAKKYEEYEEERVGEIRKMIDSVDESEGLKKEVFQSFLAKIYKRGK